jgi:hypothetical protein
MKSNNKLFVGVPAYNCENQISFTLNEVLDLSEKINSPIEIAIFENNGTDKTLDVCIKFIEDNLDHEVVISLYKNNTNIGLGGSQKNIFQKSIEDNFTHVMILHGDNQVEVGYSLNSINYALSTARYDAYLGSRFMRGSKRSNYSKIRTIYNYSLNSIFSLVLKNRISDLGSGLNIYLVNSLSNQSFWQLTSNNLTFNYDMLIKSYENRFKMHYFPIHWKQEGQVSNVKVMSQLLETLKILIKYIFRINNVKTSGSKSSQKNYKLIISNRLKYE